MQLAMPEVQLTADLGDILCLPSCGSTSSIGLMMVVTLGVGLAASGAGSGAAIARLPGDLVTLTQQILTGQFEAALTTIEDYLSEAGVAIIGPTLAAIIERRERYLVVARSLQTAVPTAIVQLGAESSTPLTASRGRPFKAPRSWRARSDGDFGNLLGVFMTGPWCSSNPSALQRRRSSTE